MGRRSQEIGVSCRNWKEHYHILHIIVCLQHLLRKTALMKTDRYPDNKNKFEKWGKATLRNYINLIPAKQTKNEKYPLLQLSRIPRKYLKKKGR